MRVDKLIEELKEVRDKYGNLPLSDFNGMITTVNVLPCKSGVRVLPDEQPNEIYLGVLNYD